MTTNADFRGVRLLGVTLERLRFEESPDAPLGGEGHLDVRWRIERRLTSESASAAQCAVRVILTAGPESKAFLLDATLVGQFQEGTRDDKVPLPTFMAINAPAQIVPFVRELVANLTVRSRRGMVMLPSVNVVHLVQQIDAEHVE